MEGPSLLGESEWVNRARKEWEMLKHRFIRTTKRKKGNGTCGGKDNKRILADLLWGKGGFTGGKQLRLKGGGKALRW